MEISVVEKEEIKAFRKYVAFLNPILKQKERELDVLSYYMMLFFRNRDKFDSKQVLKSTPLRKMIRESLSLSEASFNNALTLLRKASIIDKGTLSEPIKNLVPVDYPLIFKISIHEK